MTQKEFINKITLALNTHTVYGSGAFGASVGNFPSQKERYYKNTLQRCGQTEATKLLTEAAKPPCFAFDCAGLIKGAGAWGWAANPSSVYGSAIYESNGVGDWGAGEGKDDLITHCTDVSTDFKNIVAGEMLWINGHVGVYIGDGYAIECTTAWTGNVQKTVVTNIKKAGTNEHGRKWTKHGKLPWVTYDAVPAYAVTIGTFKTKAEAEKVQAALKTLGTSSTVTTL